MEITMKHEEVVLHINRQLKSTLECSRIGQKYQPFTHLQFWNKCPRSCSDPPNSTDCNINTFIASTTVVPTLFPATHAVRLRRQWHPRSHSSSYHCWFVWLSFSCQRLLTKALTRPNWQWTEQESRPWPRCSFCKSFCLACYLMPSRRTRRKWSRSIPNFRGRTPGRKLRQRQPHHGVVEIFRSSKSLWSER